MTQQHYESWRISYQSSESAARAAWKEMIRVHHRANELEAQLSAIGAGGVEPLRKRVAAPQAVQAAVPTDADIDAAIQEFDWDGWIDQDKAKRAFTREALARWAAPAHPAEGVPEQAGTYAEARECEYCNHVGINDSAEGVATCVACQWIGDSPKEDKCPECEAEGAMTASCPKCHHEYRLIANATLAATKPAAQGMEKDAARWRMAALIARETIIHPDKRTAVDAVAAYMHAVHSGLDIQGAIDAAIAAQAKHGGA